MKTVFDNYVSGMQVSGLRRLNEKWDEVTIDLELLHPVTGLPATFNLLVPSGTKVNLFDSFTMGFNFHKKQIFIDASLSANATRVENQCILCDAEVLHVVEGDSDFIINQPLPTDPQQ